MKDVLESAIKALADKAKETREAHYAMQYSQAALNLAHAREVLVQVERSTA